MPDPVAAGLAQLIEQLRGSRHTLVLTGAGVSAESGLATFRDAQTGLWAKFKAEQLATPEAFEANPGLVWDWYEWRRSIVRQAEPNPGHRALAALAKRMPQLTLITQNVDGLHQRAGSTDVIEFHGNINRSICSARPCEGAADSGDAASPPACAVCGAPMRPDVVWFGEPIPPAAIEGAERALQSCDLFLSVGTSALVYPAAGLAGMARARGAIVAEINPDATPLSGAADIVVAAKSGTALPALLAALSA